MKTRIENFTGIIKNCDERWLKEVLTTNLQQSGFSILRFTDHQFDVFGYSALWLLGESHLAIHTFPENNSSYIELSSCVEGKGDKFWARLAEECDLVQDFGKRILQENPNESVDK